MNRRLFLLSGTAFSASFPDSKAGRNEIVYRFAASGYEIRMSIEYFDAYASNGFSFKDETANHLFCYSANGEQDRNCLPNFFGSIAIARYHLTRSENQGNSITLREHVRTIDRDSRLAARAPFEYSIKFERGVASDIQAFGHYLNAQPPSEASVPAANGPWCFIRQDLYLERVDSPFLVVHWKHTLSAIRLLDVIPGERTRLIAQPERR